MNTVSFDLNKMLFDKRISASELATDLNMNYVSIWQMAKRSRIKLAFLRRLESKFGDCSQYIKEQVAA